MVRVYGPDTSCMDGLFLDANENECPPSVLTGAFPLRLLKEVPERAPPNTHTHTYIYIYIYINTSAPTHAHMFAYFVSRVNAHCHQ